MDPLSQAVVGAAVSVSCCRRKEWVRPATIAGIVGGMLPDLDVLIRSKADPLLAIEYHRHFTHALPFVPIGGLIAAMLCWIALRKKLPFPWIYIFATLGYATHGILDSMTNYGTHLWWPFTNFRESWSIISIVDPIFTLTLLALCGLAFRRCTRSYTVAALAFACVYWSLGWYQRETATAEMFALAQSRGHTVERFEVKPSFGNLVLWRAQYQYQNHYYMDAIRVIPGGNKKIYPGGSMTAFTPVGLQEGSRADKDFKRFAFFSDGWLAEVPGRPMVIGDVRFAMLPQSIMPLWAIELDALDQQKPLPFISLRQSRFARFGELWDMIRGRDVANPNDALASPPKQE